MTQSCLYWYSASIGMLAEKKIGIGNLCQSNEISNMPQWQYAHKFFHNKKDAQTNFEYCNRFSNNLRQCLFCANNAVVYCNQVATCNNPIVLKSNDRYFNRLQSELLQRNINIKSRRVLLLTILIYYFNGKNLVSKKTCILYNNYF